MEILAKCPSRDILTVLRIAYRWFCCRTPPLSKGAVLTKQFDVACAQRAVTGVSVMETLEVAKNYQGITPT